jgi:hypothetical protein
MGKKMAQRRPWFLWIGGACFLVGSLVAGSVGLASSAGPPNQSVTANQGTGTGSGGAWKVDGSGVTQPVSGTVGVTGTVGIDPSQNAVTSGDVTSTVTTGTQLVSPGQYLPFGSFNVSAYKDVRVVVSCGLCTGASSLTVFGGDGLEQLGTTNFVPDPYIELGSEASLEFEVPGDLLAIGIHDGDINQDNFVYTVYGRTN